MKRRVILLLTAVIFSAVCVTAQTVQITASNIAGASQQLLPAGIISFCPAGSVASGFQIGGVGQTGGCVQRDVVNGVIQTTLNGTVIGPMLLADTNLSAPQNPCYNVTVRDPSGAYVIGTANGLRSGYSCVQPAANVSPWCTSGVCNFDLYVPDVPDQPLGQSVQSLVVGDITIDGTCTGNCAGGSGVSLETDGVSNQTQGALNIQDGRGTQASNPSGANVQIAVTYGTSANTAAQGNDSRITGAEQVARKGIPNGYAPLDANALLPAANSPNAALGKICIGQGGSGPCVFSDPLVQGTQADGSTSEPNPVLGGVWDGAALHAQAGDASGNTKVAVQGSVSVGNFPATQNVAVTNTPSVSVSNTPNVNVANTPSVSISGTPNVSVSNFPATQPVSAADGQQVTIGAKADAKSTATDTTAISIMQVLKEISYMEQNPASTPVTGTFWQATQPVSGTVTTSPPANASTNISQYGGVAVGQANPVYTQPTDGTHNMPMGDASARSIHVTPDSAPTTPVTGTFWQTTQPASLADGADTTLGAKADAKNTATDTTAISIMQVLKEISYMEQNPASTPVTGTFWQTTQPMSSTQLPSALDGSGYLKTHEQGTANVSVTNTPSVTISGTPSVSISGTPAVTESNLDSSIGTPASAAPSKAVQAGGTDGTNLVVPYIDPCQRGAKSYYAISLTANTKMVSGTSGKKIYVCSVNLVAAAATNVAIVEGTGTTCGTSTAGMAGLSGGSTAATGWNFAANGGVVQGVGGFAVGAEATSGDDLCILVSAANQISGGLSYVVY